MEWEWVAHPSIGMRATHPLPRRPDLPTTHSLYPLAFHAQNRPIQPLPLPATHLLYPLAPKKAYPLAYPLLSKIRKGTMPAPTRTLITQRHECALIAALLNAAGPVPRAKLRALLPDGIRRYAGLTKSAKQHLRGENPRAGDNDVSRKLSKRLRQWEERGLITLTASHAEVADRAALEARLAQLEQLQPKKTIAQLEREIAARKTPA